MKIQDFKLIKNRQRPEFCYMYKMYSGDTKYEIFTMDGGKTFLASIEIKRMDGKFCSELSKTCSTIDLCIDEFENY